MSSRRSYFITFIAALSLVAFVACSKKENKGHHGHKKGKTMTGPKVTANPDKKGPRIAIEVNRKGYKPGKVEAKAGNNVLVFTRTADVGCGEFVKINGIKGKTKLPLNKPVEIGINLPEKGEVKFACHMDMMTGVIAVK